MTLADARVVLHPGYPKTATTWLQHHVIHPDHGLAHLMSRVEMLQYFVTTPRVDFDANALRLLCAQRIQGLPAGTQPVLSLERLIGSPDAGGYDRLDIAERLAAVFPNAVVLVVIREQVAAIASAFKQYVRSGGYEPLDAYLRPVDLVRKIPRFDAEYYRYDKMIAGYASTFGDRLVVLPFELMRKNRALFFDKLAAVFGRAIPDQQATDVTRPSLSAAAVPALRPINRFLRRSELNQSPLMPLTGVSTFLSKAFAWTDIRLPPSWRQAANTRMNDRITAYCGDRFRESNRRTGEVLQLDLGELGYAV